MGRPGINGSVGEKGQKGESQPPVDVKKVLYIIQNKPIGL